MSFTNRTLIPIGLLVLVVISGCLLWQLSARGPLQGTQSTQKAALPAAAVQASSTSRAVTAAGDNTSSSTDLKAGLPTVDGISFEIVSSDAAQQRGLGGRAVIPNEYAMLFVFPKDDTYGFWMKDMLTSIDMVWLSDSGTIVKIDGSVPADSYPDVFYPPQPIRYVLETRAGFAEQEGWHVGTKVQLPWNYL